VAHRAARHPVRHPPGGPVDGQECPRHRRPDLDHLLSRLALAIAFALVCALVSPAGGEEPSGAAWIQRWLERPTLTGNWFGLRDTLGEWGIVPTIAYSADLLANPIGGRRRGQAYASDFFVSVDFDLGKLASIPGLSAQVAGDWAAGTNLSDDIGNFFQVAEYFEGDQLRLAALFLRQALFDGRLDIKAGRFATGDDFLAAPFGLNLVNEALNPILLAVQANVPGATAYPNSTWAGRVIARPAEILSLAAGAFYSDPFLNQLQDSGTNFAINPRAGYFVIGEAVARLNAGAGAGGLPGRYRVGGYYDSNVYRALANPAHEERGNYGFYLTGDQMVTREGGPGTSEGLSLFGVFVWAPLQRINTLPYFASVGASYRGLVPSRGRDTATFAVYYGGFSRDLPGQTHETALEWTYAIAVTPWLTVQPDVQYIIRPSGKSSIPNALVVGAQIAVSF
jgi:porin